MGPLLTLPAQLTRRIFVPLLAALAFGSVAGAQVVPSSPTPVIGSAQPVSPEPTIIEPHATACKVTLLNNATFSSAAIQSSTYTPSTAAGCAGPWAKVIFKADFTIQAGTQTERNVGIYLGNATLFRGTTPLPSSSLSPSWHVEGDVTDLSALFGTTQTVVAASNITTTAPNTAPLYASAELDFYAAGATALAATVPDQVFPVVVDPTNPVQTFSTMNPLTVSLSNLPKNMTQLYLDVIAQPDEYWWLSTPDPAAAPYISGQPAKTALRELDVSIDTTPAGIAPNHPYIYAGGLDPYLWRPIPGAQALHLQPYRINLTPFAGALSDGNTHTIVINDINTVGTAYINADLLVYTDHGGATVTGEVTGNSLTGNPGIVYTTTGALDGSGNGNITVNESQTRNFIITGYVNTAAGKVITRVTETVNFANSQQLTNQTTAPVQKFVQDNLTSTVDSTVLTVAPTGTTTATYHTENPLQATINLSQNANGSYTQTTTATLNDVENQLGPGKFSSNASESSTATDTLALDANKNITLSSGQASTGNYQATDSLGNSYSETLTAANNVLTGAPTATSTSSGSTLFVSASATTIAQGSTVTLTATDIPTNSTLVPTGQVIFYSNGKQLSTNGLVNGVASVGINFLPVGVNTITAIYLGDNNFIQETSMNVLTVTVTAVAGSFTVGPVSPATISIAPGASAVVSVPVTSGPTFTGTVALTCTGAPTGSTCVVNPTSVALVPSVGSVVSSQTVSVVVTTAAAVAENHVPSFGKMAGSLGGISMAGIFLLMLPKRRSKGWKSMTLTVLLFCGLGLCSVATLTGCGSGGTKPPTSTGTPAGTYTITVTGTSGAISNSATFALTVN